MKQDHSPVLPHSTLARAWLPSPAFPIDRDQCAVQLARSPALACPLHWSVALRPYRACARERGTPTPPFVPAGNAPSRAHHGRAVSFDLLAARRLALASQSCTLRRCPAKRRGGGDRDGSGRSVPGFPLLACALLRLWDRSRLVSIFVIRLGNAASC
jgi:hypothetical protein